MYIFKLYFARKNWQSLRIVEECITKKIVPVTWKDLLYLNSSSILLLLLAEFFKIRASLTFAVIQISLDTQL